MFTLLPEPFKHDIIASYRKRVLTVSLLGLVSVASVSLIFSLSIQSYVFGIRSELKTKEMALNTLSAEFSKNDLGVNIDQLNQDLTLLSPNAFDFSVLMNTIKKSVPNGITLERIEYMNFEVNKFMVTVSGKSASRKLLSQFSETLRGEPKFQMVELPLGVLAKDSNIPFSIKISGTYE